MSISAVKLSFEDASDSESSEVIEEKSFKSAFGPKRVDLGKKMSNEDSDPFAMKEEEIDALEKRSVKLTALGLNSLSVDSDPFLNKVSECQFTVKRHRIWIRGIKGVKFTLTLMGHDALFAKRKRKYMKNTYFISRSENFSIDSMDLVGILVKQHTGKSYTLFNSRERKGDRYRNVLGGIDLSEQGRLVVVDDVWLPQDRDNIFEENIPSEKAETFKYIQGAQSVKNASFGDPEILRVEKQPDKTLSVWVKSPLCILHAFGVVISLFTQ